MGEPSAGEAFCGPPPRFPAKLNLEAQSLRWTGWMPLFEDVDNKIFLYHTETESVRAAPSISLRDEGGFVYFQSGDKGDALGSAEDLDARLDLAAHQKGARDRQPTPG